MEIAERSEFNLERRRILEKAPLCEGITPTRKQIVDFAVGNEKLRIIREQMDEDQQQGIISWVDLDGGDLDKLKEHGFKHAGIDSYLISPVSGQDWFSDHYFNCTAVVAIGRDANTGKEISFLSHQDPGYFIDGDDEKKENFSQALAGSLNELKLSSHDETIEVFLLGGNFDAANKGSDFNRQYLQSIDKLKDIVQRSVGFDPEVICGPNSRMGSETTITVETQDRNIWIERDDQASEFDESFQANDLDEIKNKWSCE